MLQKVLLKNTTKICLSVQKDLVIDYMLKIVDKETEVTLESSYTCKVLARLLRVANPIGKYL